MYSYVHMNYSIKIWGVSRDFEEILKWYEKDTPK